MVINTYAAFLLFYFGSWYLLTMLVVMMSVCLSSEASHRPSDHMISSRPLIGQPPNPTGTAPPHPPPPYFFFNRILFMVSLLQKKSNKLWYRSYYNHCLRENNNTQLHDYIIKKNLAYGRHQLYRPMRIVGPTQI